MQSHSYIITKSKKNYKDRREDMTEKKVCKNLKKYKEVSKIFINNNKKKQSNRKDV